MRLGIFPEPQKVEFTPNENSRLVPASYFCGGPDAGAVSSWCDDNGFVFGQGDSSIEILLVKREDERALYVSELNRVSDEKYEITISLAASTAEIRYASSRGLRHALATLTGLHRTGGLRSCEIEDFPSFPLRGVIEGYYGPPWSDDQRAEIIRLLSDYKMNTYVYGPKDDPYHRERWADEYDDTALRRLRGLVDLAVDCGVTFCYSIGPGLSLRYSSDDDREQLINKLRQLYGIGVRSFALLLDDIPRFLQHQGDIERYPDLITAQIELVTRVYDALIEMDSGIHFSVCPTDYHGKGTEYTVSRLGLSIHPAIDIFWTGPEICSRELTMEDAARFAEATHHLPLYWDNYPVNDLEMAKEMHIGPYENRDRGLWHFSRGILANGMEFAEASKVSFITIACFSWNPDAYDTEACNSEALLKIGGDADHRVLKVFAENVRESCLTLDTAPVLSGLLERFRFQYLFGKRDEAVRELNEGLQPLFDAAERLKSPLSNRRLQKELHPWMDKFRLGVELLRDVVAFVGNPDEGLRDKLTIRLGDYMKAPFRVFSDVLYPALQVMLENAEDPQVG